MHLLAAKNNKRYPQMEFALNIVCLRTLIKSNKELATLDTFPQKRFYITIDIENTLF